MANPSRLFLIASFPAALVSVYGLGLDLATRSWLPLLGLSLLVSWGWAELFSRRRQRPLDGGWILAAWLFALLLPPATPFGIAAVGLSFGLVFGCHVFGGTGRYLVNPALLGVIFISISYLPPPVPTEAHPGLAIASLIGCVFLIIRGAASARLIAGALTTVILASLFAGLAWQSHLTLGYFAFVLAFVATDPTTRPSTAGGCWAFGVLFGGVTIALRTLDPAEPEGSLPALLLVSLCVPLLDRISLAWPFGKKPAATGGDT